MHGLIRSAFSFRYVKLPQKMQMSSVSSSGGRSLIIFRAKATRLRRRLTFLGMLMLAYTVN